MKNLNKGDLVYYIYKDKCSFFIILYKSMNYKGRPVFYCKKFYEVLVSSFYYFTEDEIDLIFPGI